MRASAAFLAFTVCAALPLIGVPLVRAQAPQAAPAGDDAEAQTQARQRYKSGMDAWQSKRYVEAALQFEAATEQKPNAAALFMAASSWELANAPDRAADDFARAIAVPGLPAENVQTARSRLAALEAVLGRVEVTAPEGFRVQLDANTEVPTPATLHGNAGVHALAVRAPDRPIERRQVVLQAGQATKLALTSEAPSPPSSSPPAKVEPPPEAPASAHPAMVQTDEPFTTRARRPAGFVLLGVGVAALGAGAVMGTQALDAKDAYNAAPTRAGFDHASSLQSWTNILLIGGGVVAAGGLVLVLWPSSKPEAPAVPTTKPDEAKEKEAARLSIVPTPAGAILRGAF